MEQKQLTVLSAHVIGCLDKFYVNIQRRHQRLPQRKFILTLTKMWAACRPENPFDYSYNILKKYAKQKIVNR